MRKILICLLALVTLSCTAYKYGDNSEPTQKSNLTFGMVKSKIIKNVTNQ